ncbi:bifunctional 4-hydroxy-2-oxoglutarate aldolase/2-dehydro-3-deoxy-phosphogluconate aldolase [bacterium]|nr:bifunctional 4-hydroxy-2-oxoglutarate aldolase/2-dehydro-3-deoxy-phosphogluconate aldolase [bacterium]
MRPEADLLTVLGRTPVIGIMRGCPLEHVISMGTAAADAGFEVIEVTSDSPNPAEAIGRLRESFPGLLVGAGTVLTPADVPRVVDAGASFIVTPMLSMPVMEAAVALGVPIIPGAATPTEIWQALEAGAAAVKVFPARELGGPSYLGAIRAPLGHPPLVPTGGVGAADARAYLDAGALALGIGGSVFSKTALVDGDAAGVASRASALIRELL